MQNDEQNIGEGGNKVKSLAKPQ